MGLYCEAYEFKNVIAINNLGIIFVLQTNFQGYCVPVTNYVFFDVDKTTTVGSHPSGSTDTYVKNGCSMQPSVKSPN